MSYHASPIELLSAMKKPRGQCFYSPLLQTNNERLDESLPQVEQAIQHSTGDYEKLKLEFEDLKKTCVILVANLHASEKKLEAATIENLVLKSAARLDELQRENKQLQDERTSHQISQRNCLNEIQSLRKERSNLYTKLQQAKQTSKLRMDTLQFTLKRERAQKHALQDEVVVLRDVDEVIVMQDALKNANPCMNQESEIGEHGDGGMLSSVDRPESYDVRARLDVEAEDLKAQLRPSAESFATSRLPLEQETVAPQVQLELLTPEEQEKMEWMAKFMRVKRFKARRDYLWAMVDTDLGFWVVNQRQQLREYEGSNKRRIDLLNSIDFKWGDGHPLNKKPTGRGC